MSEKKKNFIGMMAPHVREVAARTGLDPRLILAQSAVETGWGGKAPGHNYFGIKSHNREGGQNFMTTEYIRGAPVKKIQNFREYSGPEESSRDYASFILENPRYQEAMKAKGIDDQIKAIGKSGYATDPRYGRKLRAVALGIELPPELPPEDKPVVEEQRPIEQKQQAQPTEQPQPPEQEAEAVSYNQIDPRDEPVAFADGGSVNDQPLRDLNASGLYSHAAEMASQLPQERGSPQQMAGMLTNKYGVKPVEMEGFDEAFAGQPSVTRDQLVQHFTNNMPQIERKVLGGSEELYPDSEPTKFSKYALPGGENYREVLLKMPQGSAKADAIYDRMAPFYSIPNGTSSSEFKALKAQHDALTSMFESSHYPDPNILVHTRLSDRTGPNNEKILHIEEIQSDWAQKGRKVGFADKSENWAQKYADFQKQAVADWIEKKTHDVFEQNPALFGSLDKSREMAQIAAKHYGMAGIAEDLGLSDVHENLYKKMDQFRNGVPSAPYVTNTAAWTDLALKDILNEAVNGGYDKVVWTPGAEQAKRYDLSKQVGKVYYDPELAGGTLAAEGLRPGQTILDKPNIKPENIADYIGKEAAEKLLAQPRDTNGMHILEGSGLSVGGEGMKGYYDKIVPTQLSKLLKKLDPEARIGTHNIDTRSPADKKMGLPEGQSINTVSAQSITITPKMREALKRGLPAFADGGSVDDEDEGLTAYHGSPHDFEQFDTSKIGTGEGAQAYGHGLYFAESEPVAKEYRDRLTDKTTNFRVGNIDMPKWILRSIESAEDKNAAIETHRQDFSGRLAEAETERETSNQPWLVSGRISTAKDILAGLDQLQQGTPAPHTKGRMYEVKINAHPDHFLDWDAPIYEQPQFIQDAVKKSLDYAKENAANGPSALSGMFVNSERSAIQAHSDKYLEHDGAVIQNMLEKVLGAQGTSDALAQHGVKGIKYFDVGSRGQGGSPNAIRHNLEKSKAKLAEWQDVDHPTALEQRAMYQRDIDMHERNLQKALANPPTRNYVVFNNDHVQVKRKYAQGGAIAGAEFVL